MNTQKSIIKKFTGLIFVFSIVLSACASPASTPTTDTDPGLIKLTVGASPVPHSDILNFIKENLAEKAGLDLTIVEFTDYVQPNLALADGQLDANYFQHVPYLEDFNKEHKLDLVPVANVHIEPLGIYSKKIKNLDELAENAVVAIPNDATNGGRALRLLEANGLITLRSDAAFVATVQDISNNPKDLEIKELEAAQLVHALDDVTVAVINGNYAIEAGFSPAKDALGLESGENNPYANVLAVNSGHENDEGIQILAKLLTSPEVAKFIEEKYEGSVIAVASQVAEETATEAAAEVIKLTVGVSPVPHSDILNFIKDNLAEKAGLDLIIVEFTDYVQPNLALADGQLDANYFQHVPYLEDFNKEHSLSIVPVVGIHIEPLGIYSKKFKSLDELPEGSVVAIPNDATNGGRALRLLEANGLITLKSDATFIATVQDVTDNPKKLEIKELEAAQLVRALDDVAVAVINGNYAIEAGFSPAKDALALESGENNPYANVLAVNAGHESDKGIQILAGLFTSPEVKQFIEEKYSGSVIPVSK